MPMKNVPDTNNVALIKYDGCVSLTNLLNVKVDKYPSIVNIKPSKMNRDEKVVSCVAMKVKLNDKDQTEATLKIYASKIIYKIKSNGEQIESIIRQVMGKINADAKIVRDAKKIDITFSNFGFGKNVNAIRAQIDASLADNELKIDDKNIEIKQTQIHITGIKSQNSISETGKLFEDLFLGTNIYSDLKLSSWYSIMSNRGYSLGHKVNLLKFAQLITTAPGFEDAFCIYDNLNYAHYVTVILPLKIDNKLKDKLWRSNVEASFIVKNSGSITQSCPSTKCGDIAYKLLFDAVKYLGEAIIRK